MGKPGFPTPPPGGRVWAGAALTPGGGETGFPHPPARGRVRPSRRGMGKPGFPIPPPAGGFGRAQPSQKDCSSRRCAAQPHARLEARAACPRRRDEGVPPSLPGSWMPPDVTSYSRVHSLRRKPASRSMRKTVAVYTATNSLGVRERVSISMAAMAIWRRILG